MAGLIMDPPVSPTQHMSLITATDQSDQRSEVTGMVALGNLTTEQDGNGTNFTVPLDSMVSLHYGLPSMIVVAVVLFVVIVITAFGNFLVGLALFKYRYLRTVSNYLIGNLALSDFLLAITIIPLSTVNECLGHWVFGEITCNFWLCADVLYCTASIWNLCVIAFDRYTATLYPLWYREKRSTKQAAIYIAIVWVFSAAICVPPLLGWIDLSQNYQYDDTINVYYCNLFRSTNYVMYSAAGSFFIPFFITVFLYIQIFSVLRKRMRKMRNRNKAHQARSQASTPKDKSPSNNVVRLPQTEIEMTQSPLTNDGSGNTEELSSKSLFGSDSGGEDMSEDNEEDEEDDSTQARSDNPLCVSSSDTDQARMAVKNGVKPHKLKGKSSMHDQTMVIMNRNHKTSESEKDSDMEKVHIVVTEEDTSDNKKGDAATSLVQKGAKSVSIRVIDTQTDTDNTEATKAHGPNFNSMLKSVNPFKPQRKKTRSLSQRHRYEQREMRATIRMAIIIAFFCGMWLGFFITYVIGGWCDTSCTVPRELEAFFFWLGYSNSCINPILYTIFNEEFRKAFQKILGCYTAGRGQHRRR